MRHRRLPRFGKTGYLNDWMHRLRAEESDYVLRSFTADKELVKLFVRGVTGEDLCVPTLGVIRDVSQIDDYRFPPDSVVKPTHMSGPVIFVRDGEVSRQDRERMKQWMRVNFADLTGEQHYARLQPKIIIEPWLKLNGDHCQDFKMHVSHGRMTAVDFVGDRFEGGTHRMVITRDWKRAPVRLPDLQAADAPEPEEGDGEIEFSRPKQFDRMIAIAEEIGKHFPYIRVDFYTDGEDRIYIGEFTHISGNARKRFRPAEFERRYVTG